MLKHERLLQSRVVYFSEPFCEQAPIRFTQISLPHKFGLSCLSLENYVPMHQCAISANDINPKAAFPVLLLSSAFVEQRPFVPVGEENNLLNNTLWDLFF